jgi:hypothetical protein
VRSPRFAGPRILLAEDISSVGEDAVAIQSAEQLQDKARFAASARLVSLHRDAKWPRSRVPMRATFVKRWEYCCITGVEQPTDGIETLCPAMLCATENGLQRVTEFKNRPKGLSEADAVAQAIWTLGQDGWEMVTAGNVTPPGMQAAHVLWFKRATE